MINPYPHTAMAAPTYKLPVWITDFGHFSPFYARLQKYNLNLQLPMKIHLLHTNISILATGFH